MSAEYCVVIPAFNSERYLGIALASVSRQTVAPAQVIVVNDGSSDRTAAIAQSAGATVISVNKSCGPSVARNLGVSGSTAPLVAFLDADDEWLPDHAERLIGAFDDNSVVFAGSNAEKFGSEHGVIGPGVALEPGADLGDVLIAENPLIQSAMMLRRDALTVAGGYDESIRLSEDYELWTRVAEVGQFVAVDAVTIRRRVHVDQVSQRRRGELVRAWWEVRRRLVRRRLIVASQIERERILSILEDAALRDVEWAIWTGDGAMLSIVREELRTADSELGLDSRLSSRGGLGMPTLRLAQDVRCGSRTILQFFQGQR